LGKRSRCRGLRKISKLRFSGRPGRRPPEPEPELEVKVKVKVKVEDEAEAETGAKRCTFTNREDKVPDIDHPAGLPPAPRHHPYPCL
jgi:hypothetical protein